jgi:hypothetical protein
MRSVRLDPDLDDRVRRAAEAENSTVSEFVRAALAERADRALAGHESATAQLADVIGVVHGGGGRARRTGRAFAEELAGKRKRA